MNDHIDSHPDPEVLDKLTAHLLDCGGVLSQIISHMVRTESAGLSAPDAAPIPEVAHMLLRGIIADVARLHSAEELRVAAALVDEITDAISENIFLVPPSDPNGR